MKKLIPIIILALVITTIPTAVLAGGPSNPWVIVQHEVRAGDTYPTLDSNYNVAPGTVYGMNSGAVLIVGSYVRVPTRASVPPARSSLYWNLSPYPRNYNPNLWD